MDASQYQSILSSDGKHDNFYAFLVTFEHMMELSNGKDTDRIVVFCETLPEAIDIATDWFINDLFMHVDSDRVYTITKTEARYIGVSGLIKITNSPPCA